MKILLIGANGRMGHQMQNYMDKNNINYFAVDKNNFNLANKMNFDVIVDFSSSTALQQNINLALSKHKPLLIATTNHNSTNEHLIQSASEQIPIAVCPNLSLGILCFCNMLKSLSPVSKYDFVINETHHKNKKDSPSGTAKLLDKKLQLLNITPTINATRAGSVIGEHSVIAYGENEIIEIKHTAVSRDCFCQGAIAICEKLIKQKNGIYKIEDLLWLFVNLAEVQQQQNKL